jgi:hypothetical protein
VIAVLRHIILLVDRCKDLIGSTSDISKTRIQDVVSKPGGFKYLMLPILLAISRLIEENQGPVTPQQDLKFLDLGTTLVIENFVTIKGKFHHCTLCFFIIALYVESVQNTPRLSKLISRPLHISPYVRALWSC